MEGEPEIEEFQSAELVIEDPIMDKNFMISFEAENEDQNRAYNVAISEICNREKLKPFHQVGSHESSGYQAWEMWTETDKEKLNQLLSKIQSLAKETYDRWKESKII